MKNPPESLILKLHTFYTDVYFYLRNPPKWLKENINSIYVNKWVKNAFIRA